MAKLEAQFREFLHNIEPTSEVVGYAQEAHEPVRKCLEEEDDFKQYVISSFLYGSYKRHTAVGNIKDVDIVILTNFDPSSEEHTPHKVLRKLKAALARCYEDPENPEYQRRSIRINDPLPMHPEVEMTLDIIPAVAEGGDDEPLLVPDREQRKWIRTHPKGHIQQANDLNAYAYSRGRYVPLVKIMKWWWKYQCELEQPEVERPKPKGFWVECLTGENFDPQQQYWADHFITVLQSVAAKYRDANQVPELQDPGLPDEVIRTSMTLSEFQVFMSIVGNSLHLAKAAESETDKLKSSELWRELFGEKFPLYNAEETEEARLEAARYSLADYRHVELPRWPERYRKAYKVRIDAYVYKDSIRLGGLNSNGRVLSSGLQLKYVAQVKVPPPYQVYWQVVNTGEHARRENGLRGTFFKATEKSSQASNDQLVNWESTQYTGRHWIECFVVKDEICVARSGRFYVNIKNPEF